MFEEYCNSSGLETDLMVLEFSCISVSIPMPAASLLFVYIIAKASAQLPASLPTPINQSVLFRAIFLSLVPFVACPCPANLPWLQLLVEDHPENSLDPCGTPLTFAGPKCEYK